MKKLKFTLASVLKYREHLENEQVARFREAMKTEDFIEKNLTERREDLKQLRTKRDHMLTGSAIDMKRVKSLQEEILFSELDEDALDKHLVKAKDTTEKERGNWITKKSEKDAIKKLREKHAKAHEKEKLSDEQKQIDEIANRDKFDKE